MFSCAITPIRGLSAVVTLKTQVKMQSSTILSMANSTYILVSRCPAKLKATSKSDLYYKANQMRVSPSPFITSLSKHSLISKEAQESLLTFTQTQCLIIHVYQFNDKLLSSLVNDSVASLFEDQPSPPSSKQLTLTRGNFDNKQNTR